MPGEQIGCALGRRRPGRVSMLINQGEKQRECLGEARSRRWRLTCSGKRWAREWRVSTIGTDRLFRLLQSADGACLVMLRLNSPFFSFSSHETSSVDAEAAVPVHVTYVYGFPLILRPPLPLNHTFPNRCTAKTACALVAKPVTSTSPSPSTRSLCREIQPT
jgi:hypothetical protein